MIRSPWRGRSGDIGAWRTDCTGSWMSLSARTTAGCGTAPPPATSPCCARSPSTWSPRTAAAGPAYAAGARRPPGTTTTCSSSSSATLMREPCLAVLVACRRLAAGRKRRPTAAIIDTRSVRTGPQRGPRGYDAHKKVEGRKRVLMVDVGGDPLGVRVVPADVQDRDALAALGPDLAAHPSLRLAWMDLGFAAERCGELLARHGVVQELVGTVGRRGFVVEPRRWKVIACTELPNRGSRELARGIWTGAMSGVSA